MLPYHHWGPLPATSTGWQFLCITVTSQWHECYSVSISLATWVFVQHNKENTKTLHPGPFVAEKNSMSYGWNTVMSSFPFLTHWPLGDLDAILKLQFSISFYWLVSSHCLRIVPWDECQRTSPMISQHWFTWWLGTKPSGNKPLPEPMLT